MINVILVAGDIVKKKTTPIVLLCGPRKSGKTTFSRQLIKRFLEEEFTQVMLLDLDCGQTLLFPGQISLVSFSSSETERFIKVIKYFPYGSVNPTKKISSYEVCIRESLAFYIKEYYCKGIPMVIDTMGWITGIGILVYEILLRFRYLSDVVYMKTPKQDMDFQSFCCKLLSKSRKSWSFYSVDAKEPSSDSNLAEARKIRIIDHIHNNFRKSSQDFFGCLLRDCFEEVYTYVFAELINKIAIANGEFSVIRSFNFDTCMFHLLKSKEDEKSVNDGNIQRSNEERNQFILEHLSMSPFYTPVLDFEMPFHAVKLGHLIFRRTRRHIPRIYRA